MMEKVRFVRSKSKLGIDGAVWEVAFIHQPKEGSKYSIKNPQGREYGSIKIKNGKGIVCLVLSRFIRDSNIIPFGVADLPHLERIRNNCISQIEQVYGPILRSELKSIESNITQTVSGKATPSDVIDLIYLATLSSKRDNVKYGGPSKKCDLEDEARSVWVPRAKTFGLKAYSKTQQMLKQKSQDATGLDSIPEGLLRIEIVMLDRTLKWLFRGKSSISGILTEESIIKVLREFKRIFCYAFIDGRIKPYLTKCTKRLIANLFETESPAETAARYKKIITDKKVLQKAIKRWQEIRGVAPNSKRDADYYAEKYALPEDVILTLKDFKASCG